MKREPINLLNLSPTGPEVSRPWATTLTTKQTPCSLSWPASIANKINQLWHKIFLDNKPPLTYND